VYAKRISNSAYVQAGDQVRATDAIGEAQQVIDQTRAIVYQPFLHECRADFAGAFECDFSADDEKREALRLFTEFGAEGHVQRITRS
jgi:hypothetical protein